MSARYTLMNGKPYRRGHSMPYQRCVRPLEAEYIMKKIHNGVCGNHSMGRALAFKCLRQGYYWPTMNKDTLEFSRKCLKCQQFAKAIKSYPEKLTLVICAWPFAK